MNQHDDDYDGSLEERARRLAREVAPRRDLWPGIESRLPPRAGGDRVRSNPFWRTGHWLPIGVAMVAGYLLATWFPIPWGVSPATQNFWPEVGTEFARTRVELLNRVQPVLDNLSAKTGAVVANDLTGLEYGRVSIEEALTVNPNSALLKELQTSTLTRELQILQQVDRLTNDFMEIIVL